MRGEEGVFLTRRDKAQKGCFTRILGWVVSLHGRQCVQCRKTPRDSVNEGTF